jgi:NhaP-type Na+/H+ or K+/H+ antiporter
MIIGLVSGYIIYFILNTKINEKLAYLIVLTSSIVIYISSEQINASGVIALTVFALIFGNYHIKHKLELEKFTSIFSYIFNIFVFILIGTILLIDFQYIIKGTLLFVVYLLIRFISINLALINSKINLLQKIFMTLNITKGMEVAIIILLMITRFKNLQGINIIINLSLLFCLYSFVFSSITGLYAQDFLKNEQKK